MGSRCEHFSFGFGETVEHLGSQAANLDTLLLLYDLIWAEFTGDSNADENVRTDVSGVGYICP